MMVFFFSYGLSRDFLAVNGFASNFLMLNIFFHLSIDSLNVVHLTLDWVFA